MIAAAYGGTSLRLDDGSSNNTNLMHLTPAEAKFVQRATEFHLAGAHGAAAAEFMKLAAFGEATRMPPARQMYWLMRAGVAYVQPDLLDHALKTFSKAAAIGEKIRKKGDLTVRPAGLQYLAILDSITTIQTMIVPLGSPGGAAADADTLKAANHACAVARQLFPQLVSAGAQVGSYLEDHEGRLDALQCGGIFFNAAYVKAELNRFSEALSDARTALHITVSTYKSAMEETEAFLASFEARKVDQLCVEERPWIHWFQQRSNGSLDDSEPEPRSWPLPSDAEPFGHVPDLANAITWLAQHPTPPLVQALLRARTATHDASRRQHIEALLVELHELEVYCIKAVDLACGCTAPRYAI
jgi:hypothetical protein